jgi:ABC-type multidrug transport system ATPase subunit
MPIAVEARKVSVSAGFKTILSSISFRARPGQVTAILGPSGAGKSTLFRALNGSQAPDGGQVFYGGEDLYAAYDRYRTRIGYVPQDDILHDALTARDVLFYAGRLRMPEQTTEEEVERRVAEVLEQVELSDRAGVRVRRLSGGQRKRVNLGVELMTGPPVLFLDEPTSGLDPALEEKMMVLFRRLARDNRTVFLTTHVTESLDQVDRVLLLCAGKLVFAGPPAEAQRFFGVSAFVDIYAKLASGGADHWAGEFARRGPVEEPAEPSRPGGAPVPAGTVAPAAAKAGRGGKSADELLAQLERELDLEKRR